MDITPFGLGDFDDYRRARARFLDRLAADALLRAVEREHATSPAPNEVVKMDPIDLEADLTILAEERRLVIGFYTSVQRDLADIVRCGVDAPDASDIVNVGRVHIRIERPHSLR